MSGATGLVYEVVWTRLLTLIMGNTHYSIATVLTAFMGGLAPGSFVGGKIIDRDFNPLAAYAILEAGIGIYCLLIPLFIELAFPLFQWIYLNLGDSYTQTSLVRFLVCGVLLIIPATFMGATLPVLSKLVTRDENFIGKDVGRLYSINTFGAVVGALASAFVFMRFLGVQATISVAAAANICIALIIYFIFKLFSKSSTKPSEGKSIRDKISVLLLGCRLLLQFVLTAVRTFAKWLMKSKYLDAGRLCHEQYRSKAVA